METPRRTSEYRRQSGLGSASVSEARGPDGFGGQGRITDSEEIVFQRMAYRKLERQMRGTYKNDKPWTILWTFLTLLLLFGVVAPNFVDIGGDDENGEHHKKSFDIQINIRDLGFLSLIVIITLGTLVYTLTRVVVVVRWSLYWLLATLSVLYLWKRQINLFSSDTPLVLLIGFGILEFLTFFIYIVMNFAYPPLVKSEFFRKNVGVTWWFGVKAQSRQHWTLTYSPTTWFEGRRTCTYRGETDAEGLPHGFGNWLDDSFHGELLSGLWERGSPVGPFRSREFGSGFAFESLRIGYVHCSDDTFTSRKYFPSQFKIPTVGVASVECSVAGGFFSHLPRAEIREGPFCLASVLDLEEGRDVEQGLMPVGEHSSENPYASTSPHHPLRPVKDVLPFIKVLYTEHPSSSLIITATRGRGVLVSGHTYLGGDDTAQAEQLVIDVVKSSPLDLTPPMTPLSAIPPVTDMRSTAPSVAPRTIASEVSPQVQTEIPRSSLLLADDDEGDEDEEDTVDIASSSESRRVQQAIEMNEEEEFSTPLLLVEEEEQEDESLFFNLSYIPATTFHNQLLQQQAHLVQRPHSDVLQGSRVLVSLQRSNSATLATPQPSSTPSNTHSRGVSNTALSSHENNNLGPAVGAPGPYLRVRDWKSTVDGHVEALIFFPGFNASLEHSCERLGQFMAMGRFPPHIKPVVFSWPCGREMTYLWAAEMAASERTHHALAALLRGLEAAGVKDVHFLVHSLGSQVVCTALRDVALTGERSEVSKLFANATHEKTKGGNMRLRTLTLLNPDTPLSTFVRGDFKCLRRVCDHITVVGDRKDGALDWSEMGNGLIRTLKGLRDLFFPRRVPVDEDDNEKHSSGCCTCGRHSWALCCRSCLDGCCRPYRHGVDRLFSRVLTVGKNIFSLYVRAGSTTEDEVSRPFSHQILHRAVAFARAGGKDVRSMTEDDEMSFDLLDDEASPKKRRNRKWLDVDVIDTSSMETNVHQLRHAYFDLNKILVEDLHELIVTGRRAAERSLLLHREGNIFSFCQAPACVVNK